MPARPARPWTRTWALLTPEERRQAAWLLPLVTLMAFAEAGGVAILAPFLELLTGPDAVRTTPWAAWASDALGFEQPRTFLLAFGAAVMVALLAANGVLVVGTWALYRFAAQRGHALSMRLLEGYLHEPYERFRARSSADVVDTVVQEAREVAEEILVPGVRLVAKAASVVGITVLLVLVDPVMAAVLAGVLGGAYLLLAAVTRRRLAALGRARSGADRAVLRVAQEAAAGRKEVTLAHAEAAVAARFARPSQAYADAEASKHVLRHVPRYALEGVAFAGLVAVVVLLMGTGRAAADLVPTLGLYAFAGYRLIPALHLVYEGVTRVRYGSEALDAVYARLGAATHPHPEGARPGARAALPDLAHRITLEDVHYAYPGPVDGGPGDPDAAPHEPRSEVLRGVDAAIDVGTTAAFVGPTGSGKTTLLDVLLGLVSPTRGAVTIDGVPLGPETMRSWWRQVGYVAQAPFLADDTVAGNVAFGAAGTHVDGV
ncbi:MAG: ABC transporter ATP-binding protein, partial [Trueperaceae bacterium]|nr:ABC transporter ATP-binding protein [Trueperaceae bacterium]